MVGEAEIKLSGVSYLPSVAQEVSLDIMNNSGLILYMFRSSLAVFSVCVEANPRVYMLHKLVAITIHVHVYQVFFKVNGYYKSISINPKMLLSMIYAGAHQNTLIIFLRKSGVVAELA